MSENYLEDFAVGQTFGSERLIVDEDQIKRAELRRMIASVTPKKAESIRRQRIAELTSGIGALVLGIGLGAMLADRLAGLGLWALVTSAPLPMVGACTTSTA